MHIINVKISKNKDYMDIDDDNNNSKKDRKKENKRRISDLGFMCSGQENGFL